MKISYPDSNKKLEDNLRFNNQFGKYLISSNFTWHGGIHIEKSNSPIKAIADGRIIAYRIQEEYEKRVDTSFIRNQKGIDSYNKKKLEKTLQYSNNFILVQHDLELKKEVVKNKGTDKQTTETEKEVITFYSLYHHLMSLNELKNKDKLPNFLSASNLVVTPGLKDSMRGIEVYPLVKKEKEEGIYLRDKENKLFLPIGTKFSFAEDINEEYSNELTVEKPKKGGGTRKVPYKRITLNEGEVDGIDASKQYYIIKGSSIYKKDSNANTAVIIGIYDKVEPKKRGASVFERPDTKSKLIEILKSESKVETVEEEGLSKNWYKISEGKYVRKNQIDDKKTLDKSKTKEKEIIADDIPIKGGDLLGYVGSLNDESHTNYKAAQVDVFMTDKVKYFLTNQFKAGTEEDKKYVILPKGTEILKLIEFDGEKPKKGTKVKVLEIRDNFYAKIAIAPKPKPKPVTAIFSKKFLFSEKMKLLNRNSFKIVDKSLFNEINKKFDNKLPNANVVLKWFKRCDKDGNDFKGNLNQRRKQDLAFVEAKKEVYVRLKYTPKAEKAPLVGKEFWIEYKHLEKYLDEKTITLNNNFDMSYFNSNAKVKEYVAKPEKREKEEEVELKYLKRKVPKPTQKVLTVEIPRDYLRYKEIDDDTDYYVIRKGVDPSSCISYARLVNSLFDDKLVNSNCRFLFYKGCNYRKNGKKYIKAKYEWEKHYNEVYPDNDSKKTKEEKEKKKKKEQKRKQQLKTFTFPYLRGVKPGEQVLLASNVTKAYLAIPDDARDIFNQYTEKDVVVKFKNVDEKKSKKNAAKPYHYKKIVCEYILNNKTVRKVGWVDASKFKPKDYFSAFNWDKFGFATIENSKTEFAYELNAKGHYVEVRSKVVQNIWDKLDANHNNEIDTHEIHSAFRTKETQEFISKLVWQHKSEWAYSYNDIQQAIKNRYDNNIKYLTNNNPHITEKGKDILKKIQDIKLQELSEQVNNLMFWKKAKEVNYEEPKTEVERKKVEALKVTPKGLSPVVHVDPKTNKATTYFADLSKDSNDTILRNEQGNADCLAPTKQEVLTQEEERKKEKETKIARKFPSTEKVYHFHPIAFVNHMKLIFGEGGSSECHARERVKAFMTMLRVGEGTLNDIGYETIVGGYSFSDYGKDMSTHPDVYIKKHDSRAAGAYQITRTNWNDTSFVNWRNKNNITDFSPVSQDKYCIYLLRNKRKVLDLIIKGHISEAIRNMGQEWASLPSAGAGQREEKMEDVVKYFIDYYQKELAGETMLHISNEELDEMIKGYSCKKGDFYDNSGEKTIIDLRDKVTFFDQGIGNANCNATCVLILSQLGLKPEFPDQISAKQPQLGKKASYYQLAEEDNTTKELEFYNDDFVNGVTYLDKALEKGEPVMVGTDHTYMYIPKSLGYRINEYTTDHYVLIIGRNYKDGKVVYPYLDVGTQFGGKGDYYFTLESDRLISSSRKNKNYTITQIRRNDKLKK